MRKRANIELGGKTLDLGSPQNAKLRFQFLNLSYLLHQAIDN